MAGIKDALLQYGPQLAMAFMAAKQGGPQALAAFQHGLQQAQLQSEQRGLQQQELERRSQHDAAMLANTNADNERQNEALRIAKFNQALALMERAAAMQGETATDPEAAQAALMQQGTQIAGAYGLPPEQLTAALPPVAPMISARKRKQAEAIYERAAKRFNPKGENPEWETSITLQTGDLFGDVTPAQLREMFDVAAVDAQGAQALPPKAQRALQILDLGGKKMAVDPTQLEHGDTFTETPAATRGGSNDNEPLVAIMGPDGAPVLVPRSQAAGKRPASTREQGRPVMSSDANRIADLDTSLNDLATLGATLTETKDATGAMAAAGAKVWSPVTELTGWGMDAKKRQGVIDRVKQVIGKALEGGVLRKEDEAKYARILPTILDPPDVAASKLEGLRAALVQRRQTTLDALTDAGYDTSKFTQRTAGAPAVNADPDSDPLGLFK